MSRGGIGTDWGASFCEAPQLHYDKDHGGTDRKMKIGRIFLGLIGLMIAPACTTEADPATAAEALPERPNILLIMADDMGFSDLGAFGSEIETPHLDALAMEGLRFTQFYAGPTCSPTRAMLMSGAAPHQVGLGTMAERRTAYHEPYANYAGELDLSVVTLAEQLQSAGYRTMTTGKWHLGYDDAYAPTSRGFDNSWVMMNGAGHHYTDMPYANPDTATRGPEYRQNGQLIELPEDFYATRTYTDEMIGYIGDGTDDAPFFALLSYTAPHWPLQAPEAAIAEQKGRYDAGYEDVYAKRIERMRELGLIGQKARAQPSYERDTRWDDLDDAGKARAARIMETYAAMMTEMDDAVGRLIDHLRETGQLDNTVIIFMSDNGAEANEPSEIKSIGDWAERCCDNSTENIGQPNSYVSQGRDWARVSAAPFRRYKGAAAEGSVRVPMFIAIPGYDSGGAIIRDVTSVYDFFPTFVGLAQGSMPETAYPLLGSSLLPLLGGGAIERNDGYHLAWEISYNRGLRQGDWKLLGDSSKYGGRDWELFNLAEDPSETRDLSETEPEKLAEMIALYERYARENSILPRPPE